MYPSPDDLQQNLNKFFIAADHILDTCLYHLEGENLDRDKMANLLIGLKELVDSALEEVSDGLEKLSGGRETGISGEILVEPDYKLNLTRVVSDTLSIFPGDIINWRLNDNGEVICRKTGLIPSSKGQNPT
jgi:hypothetical protein